MEKIDPNKFYKCHPKSNKHGTRLIKGSEIIDRAKEVNKNMFDFYYITRSE